MIRTDLSTKLIHLTRTVDGLTANERFKSILSEGLLRGSSRGIRGEFKVVAFTEAPISMLAGVLADASKLNMRYAPLGVMIDKVWLYKLGGRPVIYQPNNEFDILPESKQYLHVRYEPDRGKDYSWEREWRIKTDTLELDPAITSVIVPTRLWEEQYQNNHTAKQKRAAIVTGGMIPMRRPQWHFIVLEDLGILFENLEPVVFGP